MFVGKPRDRDLIGTEHIAVIGKGRWAVILDEPGHSWMVVILHGASSPSGADED